LSTWTRLVVRVLVRHISDGVTQSSFGLLAVPGQASPGSILPQLQQSTIVATSAISIAYIFSPKKLYGVLFDCADEVLTPLVRTLDPEASHRFSIAYCRSMYRLKVSIASC
jgi:hypothetical protein